MKLNVWQKQQDKDIIAKVILIIAIFAVIVILTLLSDMPALLSPCIGILTIDGEISMQRVPQTLFAEGVPNAEDIANTIKNIKKIKPNAKALVVVINSPGGSVVGSRIIRDAIKNSDIPTVIYLSEVAASGGYYIATGGNYIISDPNTITGSIGVIAIFADATELLEKLGINITSVTTGKYKSMGSFFSGLSDEERVIVEQLLNETYKEFIDVIIEGRKGKINKEQLMQIADGRIISGRQAKAYGLVDELGMLEDAVDKAKELANVEKDISICEITVKPGIRSSLFPSAKSLLNSLFSTYEGVKFR